MCNFMKNLIVYANPSKGHCYAILQEVKKLLEKKKEEYEVIDLYKINYDPVLHKDEHYTAGNYHVSKENKKFQKMIKETNKLIFIYPVWWDTMPAIMKGFFDKIFTSHYAFKYVNMPIISKLINGPVPVGLLKDKKATVFVTTEAKKWQAKIFLRNRFKKIVSTDILKFCGIKSKVFHLAGCTTHCKNKEKEIKKLVKKGINYLE